MDASDRAGADERRPGRRAAVGRGRAVPAGGHGPAVRRFPVCGIMAVAGIIVAAWGPPRGEPETTARTATPGWARGP
ncbi:MAG: hypothetical protein O9972_30375 [Burkholderiales bacterium]|nr:hypothetical protein [Burkholderiales bacterium]